MIPLSIPNLNGNEWKYIKECLDTNWVSSVGSYVTRFEQEFAAYVGAPYAVSMSNGTAALHIALILAGVKPHNLVIAPNITFAATLNSIAYLNAEPLLLDVCPHTWQMDTQLLHDFLTTQTYLNQNACYLRQTNQRIAAIMPVHVLGNMVNMQHLLQLSEQFHIPIVEDSTEALGSYYMGKHAGTLGQTGCFSFNGNKIMTTGGGGMLVTHNEQLARRAKHLSTQAKTDPVEYMHDEVGYNYRMVNLLAAMGVAQLEQMPQFLSRKAQIAHHYTTAFAAHLPFIQPQLTTTHTQPNHWLYTVKLPQWRNLLAHLRTQGIETRPLWTPMNQLPMYAHCRYITHHHVAAQLFEHCLSLPCSTNLTPQEQEEVIEAIHHFYTLGNAAMPQNQSIP